MRNDDVSGARDDTANEMRQAFQQSIVESCGRQTVFARHIEVKAGSQSNMPCFLDESGRNEQVFWDFRSYPVHAPLSQAVKVCGASRLIEKECMTSRAEDARQLSQDLVVLDEVMRGSEAKDEIDASGFFPCIGRQASIVLIGSRVPDTDPLREGSERIGADIGSCDMRHREQPFNDAGGGSLSGSEFQDASARRKKGDVAPEQADEDSSVCRPIKDIVNGVCVRTEMFGLPPESQLPVASVFDVQGSQSI